MNVEIMDVSPAMAKEWLTMNTTNRAVRKTVVERYARDMTSGAWHLNGEAIVLNGTRVMDGQHRLLACIASGVTFKSVVVTDAPEESMATIDQGISRTFGDVLRWKGCSEANNVASAIRRAYMWDNGLLLRQRTPTTDEALAWFEANPRITSAVKFTNRLRKAPIKLRASVAAPIFLKASEAENDAAVEFFDRLYDGEHIAHGDAVYVLRRTLMSNAARVHTPMSANQMHVFVVKAWNAWISAEPMALLRWKRPEEKFPIMIDSGGNPLSAEQ